MPAWARLPTPPRPARCGGRHRGQGVGNRRPRHHPSGQDRLCPCTKDRCHVGAPGEAVHLDYNSRCVCSLTHFIICKQTIAQGFFFDFSEALAETFLFNWRKIPWVIESCCHSPLRNVFAQIFCKQLCKKGTGSRALGQCGFNYHFTMALTYMTMC